MTQATPRTEYKIQPVTVQGARIDPVELQVAELMSGEIADSLEDLFGILGALMAARGGKKFEGLEDFQALEPEQLQKLLMSNARHAIFNITARAAGTTPELIRSIDLPSALAVFVATINTNSHFFSTLPSLLGLASGKKTEASATPKK